MTIIILEKKVYVYIFYGSIFFLWKTNSPEYLKIFDTEHPKKIRYTLKFLQQIL